MNCMLDIEKNRTSFVVKNEMSEKQNLLSFV